MYTGQFSVMATALDTLTAPVKAIVTLKDRSFAVLAAVFIDDATDVVVTLGIVEGGLEAVSAEIVKPGLPTERREEKRQEWFRAKEGLERERKEWQTRANKLETRRRRRQTRGNRTRRTP